MNDITFVPLIDLVKNRFQQEGVKDEAKVLEIASSLQQHKDNGTKGLLQVPTGRRIDGGKVELAFGHHRKYAFDCLNQEKGDPFFSEMPVILRELSDIEMFELMGIENFHRRDISPIEEANIFNTYMTAFNKTSVETGSKFEKTEEYVRGAVRLLHLPEPAKKLVEDGMLSKSAARDLLAVHKLGGDALVDIAILEIETNKFQDPRSSIVDIINTENNIHELYAHHAWTKAKKFPVKHLKPLTLINLQDVLGVDNEKLDVIKGIKQLIDAGMNVNDDAFPMYEHEVLEKVRVLANPPQCEVCPFHAVLDGDHYCGFKACKDRKEHAWKEKKFEDLVKSIGIPILQKEDGESIDLNPRDDADKKLFKNKHADLRVTNARNMWFNFGNLGSTIKLVAVGDLAEKQKKAQVSAASKGDREHVNARLQRAMDELTREYKNRFQWEVASYPFAAVLDGVTSLKYLKFHFADATDMNHDGVFPNDLDEGVLFENAIRLKKADALKELRRMIMFHALDQALPHVGFEKDAKRRVIKLSEEIQEIATEWDVKLPKDFSKQAEKYQADLNAEIKQLAGK